MSEGEVFVCLAVRWSYSGRLMGLGRLQALFKAFASFILVSFASGFSKYLKQKCIKAALLHPKAHRAPSKPSDFSIPPSVE